MYEVQPWPLIGQLAPTEALKDDQGAAADTSLEGRKVICGKRTNRKDSMRAR